MNYYEKGIKGIVEKPIEPLWIFGKCDLKICIDAIVLSITR